MNHKLLVVGTMAYDAIETPFGQVDKILGGAATYIGLSAARFDLDCAIVSVVGSDFKAEHLELLEKKESISPELKWSRAEKPFFGVVGTTTT